MIFIVARQVVRLRTQKNLAAVPERRRLLKFLGYISEHSREETAQIHTLYECAKVEIDTLYERAGSAQHSLTL